MNMPVTQSMTAIASAIVSLAVLRQTVIGRPLPCGCGTTVGKAVRDRSGSEHPREKLSEQGAQSLPDAELLALMLGSGTKGRSAVDIAQSLLAEFGSLRDLLSADPQRWEAERGIGPARFAVLIAAIELGRRYHKQALRTLSALANPDAVKTFLRAQLQDRHYEVFCCLYLDRRSRMLGFEEMFRGTIDTVSVYPREVVRQVLTHNATSVIVAHNHPSGCCQPSAMDEGLTQRLRQALSLIDVRLVDHYIVGDRQCYSFAEHGLL